jgi:hypothetical protein
MSILVLTSDTLIGTAATGNIEYNGQFFGTDSNASRAQLQRITSGTAVASTSGTSIDFTSLPAWVKRLTVMFSGVSASGTSDPIIVLGTGATPSYASSGYAGIYISQAGGAFGNLSTYFRISALGSASATMYGTATFTLLTGNTWVCNSATGNGSASAANQSSYCQGSIALSGALTAVRITTVNGTDTFDAGSVNIMYEG